MFEKTSIELHKEHHFKHFDEKKMLSWTHEDTVDKWRMNRLLSNVDPLLTCNPESKWITIGDGSYGTDAHYLHSKGVKVIATDISDYYLKFAHENNFIPEYKAENAEALSFADNEFDYALCSHAYHHFPRPSIAIYEMLRVVKKGVVLLEPHDMAYFGISLTLKQSLKWLFATLKNSLLRLVGKEGYYRIHGYDITGTGTYEDSGNFEYYLSEREIEKIALGLNLDYIAVRMYNDYYEEGVEYEKADVNSEIFKKVKEKIATKDKYSRMGISDYDQIAVIIFKEIPSLKCREALQEKGYKVIKLSKNPNLGLV